MDIEELERIAEKAEKEGFDALTDDEQFKLAAFYVNYRIRVHQLGL